MSNLIKQNSDLLIEELRQLISEARGRVASTINAELTMLYWNVGSRLRTEVLNNERAEYGEQIVASVSAQLTADYGNGFGKRNLFRMIKFAELFPESEIVTTLSAQLSWSHFVEILLVKNDLARDFYAEMCRITRRCVNYVAGSGWASCRAKPLFRARLPASPRARCRPGCMKR